MPATEVDQATTEVARQTPLVPIAPLVPLVPLVPRWVWPPALLAFVLQCVAFHGLRRDDAFITFRYAQNLANGRGLVFNVGERLMGSTSPGHTLMSSVVYAIVGRDLLPSVMSSFGCLGWTAQSVAIGVLLRDVLGPWGAWLIALAIALGAAHSAEFVSMETNIVAALLLWAIVMARERRWVATAILAALAALFRPDMYLPSLLLGALCLRDLRACAWKPALVFVALAAPWLLFAQVYFGHVIPQSAVTKYNRTAWSEYAEFQVRLAASLVSSYSQHNGWCAAMWLLAVIGAVVVSKRGYLSWVMPVFAALHFAAYSFIRPFMHHWHLYPANLVFVVLALVAVITVFGLGFRHARLRALGIAGVLALSLGYAAQTFAFAREHETAFWYGSRDSAYREIGRYLLAHAQQTDVVASVEVGTLAYYTDMQMYDWGGLVTVHPVIRPTSPRLSWTLVDSVFHSEFAPGMIPIRRFDRGEFVVDLHNFALLQEAAERVMRAHPGARPSALSHELRPDLERETAEVTRAMENSGKRVERFLADAHAR